MKKYLYFASFVCSLLMGCTDNQAEKAINDLNTISKNSGSNGIDLSFDVCPMTEKQRMAWGRKHCPSNDNDVEKMCARIVMAAERCDETKTPTRF